MGARSFLTAEILDYIHTHAPAAAGATGIAQREIAQALGYHACSMSRPLRGLVGEGLLRSTRGPVRGGVRKQIVYTLTEEGRRSLQRSTRDTPLLSGELPPPPHPFLGRAEELRELARFSAEGGTVVFVEGTAGMGKTALLSRHLRRLKATRLPFWFTVRGGSTPNQFASALAHVLAPLGARQLAYYTQLLRQPSGREVADLAVRALGHRSLAVVVDDVHAATGDLKRFLEEFVRGLLRGRADLVYLVGHEGPLFRTEGLRAHHLVLGGLDRSAAHELTDRRGGLAERFEAVFQSTLGSPLLLQLAVTNPEAEATAASLPGAVLDRLTPAERGALALVALSNEPVPVSFLEEMGAPTPDRLAGLLRTGLLQEPLPGRLELSQAIKSALVAGLRPPVEREAHQRLAAFYARSHRPEAARERFLHLVAAEDWPEATAIVDTQARTLLGLGYSEPLRAALRHLTRAMPGGLGKVRALRVEASLLRLHSDYSEAVLSLRRAVSEARNHRRAAAEAYLAIVELEVRLRQLEPAGRALEDARKLGLTSGRLRLYGLLAEGWITEAQGDMLRAHELYQEVFRSAKRNRIEDLALEGVTALSRSILMVGDRKIAFEIVDEGLPAAREAGRLDIVFNLLLGRARAYAELGERDRAEAEMRSIRTEAEALGYLTQLTYILSGLAATAVEGQRWAEVESYAKQAIQFAERLGNDLILGHTLSVLCSGDFRQADLTGRRDLLETARAHGEQSLKVLSTIPPTDVHVLAHAHLTEVYASLGDRERARAEYAETMALAEALKLNWLRERLATELEARLRSSEPLPPAADAAA